MKFRTLIAAITATITTTVILMFGGIASAHNVVTAGGVCTSPTSATFNFDATDMGDGDRTITVTGLDQSSSITTNTDGTKQVTLSGFAAQTGKATFSWSTTSIAPNGTLDIVVDFSDCQPMVTTTTAPTPTTTQPPAPTTTVAVATTTPPVPTTVAPAITTAPTVPPVPTLPATGSNYNGPMTAIAILFVFFGTIGVIIATRRRPSFG